MTTCGSRQKLKYDNVYPGTTCINIYIEIWRLFKELHLNDPVSRTDKDSESLSNGSDLIHIVVSGVEY